MTSNSSDFSFAGFWQRLASLIIDSLILLPVGLFWLVLGQSQENEIIKRVGAVLLLQVYRVTFHARWGQTVGKMVMNIKVTALDQSKIKFSQALLRSAIDICWAIFFTYFYINVIYSVPEKEFQLWSSSEINAIFLQAFPKFLWGVGLIMQFIEVLVMLTNKRRRALHDFIAGTIVINVPQTVNPVDDRAVS